MKKVYLETYGCQMNVSDSERVASSLSSKGFEITDDEYSADIILLNTCSVREKAEQKLYTRIGRVRSTHKSKPVIGVMGCVAQLEGETLFKKISGVDFVLGTRATGRASDAITEVLENGPGYSDVRDREADYDWSVPDRQLHSEFVSYLPIIEGCNKFCTYCIVPFSRGRESSLPAEVIIRQVEQLRRRGIKEVHLIGQNVNSYRPVDDSPLGGYKGKTPFSRLLRAVAATGIERIKFNTSFPRDFHPDIVEAIADHHNLCNWVHLPVQSGSNEILRRMKRLHSIERYFRSIDAIRGCKRDIAVSTDIIVGFPGETEEHFNETVKMVEYCQFDSAYIFKYSPRPGTPAFDMEDSVSEKEKTARFIELERIQKQLQKRRLQRYIDQTVEVLTEKVSSRSQNDLSGHSSCHRIVNFSGDPKFLGSIVDIRITEIKSNTLYGEVAGRT